MKKISVVIPLYNAEKFISATLSSVLNQSILPYEIVIVDDGSTDSGANVAEVLLKKHFFEKYRIIRTSNQGHSKAANVGVKEATGEYVALLDSDDLWKPKKLELIHKRLEDEGKDVLFSRFDFIDKDNSPLDSLNYPQYFDSQGFKKQLLHKGNIVYGSNSGVVVKRSIFLSVNGYDEALLACEDWDLWIRLAEYYDFDFVPDVLVSIRVHSENQSSNKALMLQNRIEVLKKHIHSFKKDNISLRKSISMILSLQGKDILNMFTGHSYEAERVELGRLSNKHFFRTYIFFPLMLEMMIRSMKKRIR